MDRILKYKKRIIIGAVVAVVLAAAFIFGSQASAPPAGSPAIPVMQSSGEASDYTSKENASHQESSEIKASSAAVSAAEDSAPGSHGEVSETKQPENAKPESRASSVSPDTSRTSAPESKSAAESKSESPSSPAVVITTVTEQPDVSESAKPESHEGEASQKPEAPVQESTGAEAKKESSAPRQAESRPSLSAPEKQYAHSCTLFISCETAVKNDKLSRATRSVLPEDGIVYAKSSAGYDEGESVFDVLKRVCGENRIHLDFSVIPMTGGAYIRGINNLYEFDCGPVSGWMYRVNGEYPNVGCSDYKLSEGDEIEFLYSCDLGADIGNIYRG